MRLQSVVGSDRILIIGDSGEASLVAALCRAIDVSSDDGDPSRAGALWVRSLELAVDVSRQVPVSKALVDSALLRGEPFSLLDVRGRAVPVCSLVDELERRFGRVYPTLAETPEQFVKDVPVASSVASFARRCLGILVATFLLLVALPCLLFISALFRLAFGPSTFLTKREMVGKGGQPVVVYEYCPLPFFLREGSRKFRVAESVRRNVNRTHLNGVPMLEDVILGRIALVGPTPLEVSVFDAAVAEYPVAAARTLVRPGLISLSRVRLRKVSSDYDVRRAIEYDLYYIKHRSLRLDARILVRASFILVADVLSSCLRILRTAIRLSIGMTQQKVAEHRRSPSSLAPPAMPTGSLLRHEDVLPALIIGAGAGAVLLLNELQRNQEIGLWPVALVDDDPGLTGSKLLGVPVLGTTMAARAVVERERIRAVVIAVPSATPNQMHRLEQIAQATEVPVFRMPAVGQILKGEAPGALVAVPVSDLLGRPVVDIDALRAQQFLGGKRVLVTGAVGSIGREVVFHALRGEPAVVYGMDINESDLYDLQQELRQRACGPEFVPIVGSVCDVEHVNRTLRRIRPHVVFHAAAYKHVPLMEDYPHEAVRTNIGGTRVMAHAAAHAGVERFVMVSTDKAVNPTSVMGATKRIAELIVQEVGLTTELSTCSVRFGNVLGSRGSVIPLFERQIENGGPVTITDPGMLRYFMTIPEAAGLIIEAGAFGDDGVVYMLDMGEPVRIVDLANRLIELKGLRPGVDIQIRYTGLRPGEKLFEELSLDFEQSRATSHQKIRILDEGNPERDRSAEDMVSQLFHVVARGDAGEIRDALLETVQAADKLAWSAA